MSLSACELRILASAPGSHGANGHPLPAPLFTASENSSCAPFYCVGKLILRPSRRLRFCHSVEHRALHESGHSLHHRRARRLRHAHRVQIARHGLHGRAAATPHLSLSQYLQPRAAARARILHEFSHPSHLHCSARCYQREPCPQARLRATKSAMPVCLYLSRLCTTHRGTQRAV